jgi:hypothetical protein
MKEYMGYVENLENGVLDCCGINMLMPRTSLWIL